MMKQQTFIACVATLALVSATSIGRSNTMIVAVPNGDFESWQLIGDGGATNAGWASVPGGETPASNVGRNDEMWTNPSNYALGWQSNGPAATGGAFGLQHPSAAHHERAVVPGPMTGPLFFGNFIGFVNANASGDNAGVQQIQSGILGTLQEGSYKLAVDVGARPVASWNDQSYRLSIVADPVLGAPDNGGPALGSRDGTVLGTPSELSMSPNLAVIGSNQQTLLFELILGPGNPDIGKEFAVRIEVENLGYQTLADGSLSTGERFTQGNFDNVRFIPEPSSAALLSLAAMGMGGLFRRRSG